MNSSNYIKFLFIGFFVILSNAFYIVTEMEQVVTTQFGKPVGDAKIKAGLYFKIPFIHTILRFDKRLLEWDGAANEIPTKDNKYIFIDTFARWKISNPLQFYKSAKNEMLAQSRLDDIIDGAVRDEVSNRFMSEIIRSSTRVMEVYDTEVESDGNQQEILKDGARQEIILSILGNVQAKLKELNLGITVVDVQIKRVSYNRQVQDKLFNRMISEQNMIAEKYRAQGEGRKQEILGKQIQKEKGLLSQAYLESQKIIGKADAKAMDIYATAYSKDPEFYNYYKTLETYKKTLDPSTLFILSTNNKFLQFIEK